MMHQWPLKLILGKSIATLVLRTGVMHMYPEVNVCRRTRQNHACSASALKSNLYVVVIFYIKLSSFIFSTYRFSMEVAACSWEYVPERDNVFAFPNAAVKSERPAKMKCPNCKINIYFTKNMNAILFKKERPKINGIQYTAKDLVKEKNKQDLSLLIICKTGMYNGNCYIGLSLEEQKLYRPIFSEAENDCCWPKQSTMEIGGFYGFEHIYRHPETDFPHKNDDLIVRRHYEEAKSNMQLNTFEERLEKISIYSKLLPLAKYTVSEIFDTDDFVKQSNGKWYTYEGVNCNSIGVLKVQNYMMYENGYGKTMVDFQDKTGQSFTAAWTGETALRILEGFFNDYLLILGLGRPWKVSPSDPRRECWMLAVGLFSNHRLKQRE